MARIVIEGFGWRPESRAVPVLRGIDVTIEAGERVLLAGASGSGKSTLLAAVSGVLAHAEPGAATGSISVDGVPAEHLLHSVGLVRQDPETNVLLARINDELRFGAENLGIASEEIRRRCVDAVERFQLPSANHARTAHLSGGQKQRLSLAAQFVMRPNIWLLDEPTAQLDAEAAQSLVEAMRDALDDQDTLILVEHQAALWWPLLTRVILLDDSGSLAFDGTPDDYLSRISSFVRGYGVWAPFAPEPVPTHQPHAGETLLELDELECGRGTQRVTVSDVFSRGQAVVLRGDNGVGKSTLALTTAGLLPPRSGTVRAHPDWAPGRRGLPLTNPQLWQGAERTSRIATVFQQPDLQFVRPTVLSEIQLGARNPSEADMLLEELRLTRVADQSPRALSGGEKRRLSVGTALASAAQLIVADEPTFGQDHRHWQSLVNRFTDALADGRCLILPSHDALLGPAIGARELRLAQRTAHTVEVGA